MGGMVQVPFGHTTVSRILPDAGPEHFSTFHMRLPLQTHWRPATCAEAGCAAYLNGWITTCDLSTDLGQRRAHFIRHDRERKFSEQRVSERLVKFLFVPGNRCFGTEHKVPLERPPVYLVTGGDWRGNPRGIRPRAHTKAEFWIEDMQETLGAVRAIRERG